MARTAEAAGKTPAELADENTAKFRALREALNLSWDDFIRTTDRERHWPGVEKLWRKLAAAGDLYKKTYRGLYCVGHEAFVSERELVGGRCPDHQREPEIVEEENWFFRSSRYGEVIRSRVERGELQVSPESRRSEILSLLKQGLEDVSFSRPAEKLSWGIPVPGDPTQTIYVWCDALANYLTAIGYGRDEAEFAAWWPADLHVIGKDILRFHAAIWPAMLLSAGLPLPKAVFVHGFITVEGKKMSKTIGNVVDPVEVAQRYGADPLRYYLLREVPSGEDGDFSIAKFEERYNGDLANGLGNLVARVAALGEKTSPLPFNFGSDISPEIKKETSEVFQRYERAFAALRLSEALAETWKLIGLTDRYLNEKKPWAAKDDAAFRNVLVSAGYIVSTITNLVRPFLPETANRIEAQIALKDAVVEIKKGEGLFPRLG